MKKNLTLLKALNDPTRLQILKLLQNGPFNVNEILSIFEMGQSRISRHLKILFDAELVYSRRDGVLFLLDSIDLVSQYYTASRVLLEDRNSHKKAYFNQIAPCWDRMKNDYIKGAEYYSVIKELCDPYTTITDAGCGTGDLIKYLSSEDKLLIGIDNSPKMLEIASKSINKLSIDLRLGELSHLPLKDEETDIIILNLVLHHLEDESTIFSELLRVVKPKGKIIIADFLSHSLEEFRMLFHDFWLGFSENRIKELLCDWENFSFNKINTEDSRISLFVATASKK
jgi:ArsR family transcriptional regulator